jgi:hypothetical protein
MSRGAWFLAGLAVGTLAGLRLALRLIFWDGAEPDDGDNRDPDELEQGYAPVAAAGLSGGHDSYAVVHRSTSSGTEIVVWPMRLRRRPS